MIKKIKDNIIYDDEYNYYIKYNYDISENKSKLFCDNDECGGIINYNSIISKKPYCLSCNKLFDEEI